jgi:hypothetical protein
MTAILKKTLIFLRIAVIFDNFSDEISTKMDIRLRVGWKLFYINDFKRYQLVFSSFLVIIELKTCFLYINKVCVFTDLLFLTFSL